METIRNYIEVLFSSLPKSKEIVEMKLNMTESMEDKYAELLAQGKSEDEAVGSIIASIGSVEDIRRELNLGAQTNHEPWESWEEESPSKERSKYETLKQEYEEEFTPKFSLAVAIAVGMYIISPIILIFFGETLKNAAYGLFFLLIAAATGILIVFGIRSEKYNILEKGEAHFNTVYKDSNTPNKKAARTGMLQSLLWCCITVIYLLMGFIGGLWHPGWVIFIFGAGLSSILEYTAALKMKD